MTGRLGTLLSAAFRRSRPEAASLARVKAWAQGAVPEASFAVNEILCTDPGCAGLETVILVMRPGAPTQGAKIAKALDDVTEQDVRSALLE